VVVVVNPPAPDFTVSLSSAVSTVNFHNSVVNTLTITPVQYSGYNLATALTCTGVPANGECTVVPSSVTPNGTAAVTAIVTLSTGSLVTSLRSHPGNIALSVSLFGAFALFGFGASKKRRSWFRMLAAAVVLLAGLTAISGCGSSIPTTGIYKLTITATGTGGQTHSAVWTVQVQ